MKKLKQSNNRIYRAWLLKDEFDSFWNFPFIETEITNATTEGINRILQMVKNRASGFATTRAFMDIIYLVARDLNISNQIPKK